jgi:hypothetical protein
LILVFTTEEFTKNRIERFFNTLFFLKKKKRKKLEIHVTKQRKAKSDNTFGLICQPDKNHLTTAMNLWVSSSISEILSMKYIYAGI